MRFKVLFVCMFSLSLISAPKSKIKLTKILETTDVGQYNRWVMSNKARYPGLKPVYILGELTNKKQVKRGPYNTTVKEYTLYYYDDNGALIKTEKVSGYVEIKFSPSHDRVIISEWKDKGGSYGTYYWTVYGKNGKKIFTTGEMVLFSPDKDIYLLTYPAIDGVPPPMTKICDGQGNIIFKTKDGDPGEPRSISIVKDANLMLLHISDGFHNGPEYLILLDLNGNEISRKEFMPRGEEVWGLTWDINKDANKISVGFNGRVYVYNRNWDLLFERKVPSRAHSQVGLSPDGKYLATYGLKTVCLFNLEKDTLLWKKRLEDAGRAKIVKVLPEGKGVVVGTKWPALVYLLDSKGKVIKKEDLGSKPKQIYIKGVPIRRKLYDTMDYVIDMVGNNIVIKVFHKPDAPKGFYSKIWEIEEE